MKKFFTIGLFSVLLTTIFSGALYAQQSGFSIQVTPSPIVETLQPGVSKTIELKIRNTAPQAEELKMGLRSFTFDDKTGQVQLNDNSPQEVADWVVFNDPIFKVQAGEWYTQKITFNPPSTAGFAYSFAITVSRSQPQIQTKGKAAIEGSVAVFTLLNIDRPDASRKLEILHITSQKKLYEYLPSTFTIRLKNSGNTIIKPGGNVYIQRTENSTNPIQVLPLNDAGSYILPNTEREVSMKWSDGFPAYQTIGDKQKLVWNWGEIQKLRFGRFNAKVIAVYNDGQRDIPIQSTVSFWVIPYKFILVALFVVLIIGVGIITIVKKIVQKTHKPKHAHETEAK